MLNLNKRVKILSGVMHQKHNFAGKSEIFAELEKYGLVVTSTRRTIKTLTPDYLISNIYRKDTIKRLVRYCKITDKNKFMLFCIMYPDCILKDEDIIK